jgi:hypothetical protein
MTVGEQSRMRLIDLDASEWLSVLDFYRALRAAIETPDWHGWSIDAFVDSMIVHDEINSVRAPYSIRIKQTAKTASDVALEVRRFADAINRAGASDRDTDLEVTIQIAS